MGGGNLQTRGFTLVEILAVIIILAAITLITVPIVTNAVKSARKGSFKVSAQNIVKAANQYYGNHGFEMDKISTFDFSKNEGKNEAGEQLLLSGKMPLSGKVIVDKQGNIMLSDISDGTYYANYDSTIDDQVVITETSEVLTRDELTEQLKEVQKKLSALETKQQSDLEMLQNDQTSKIEALKKEMTKSLETTSELANRAYEATRRSVSFSTGTNTSVVIRHVCQSRGMMRIYGNANGYPVDADLAWEAHNSNPTTIWKISNYENNLTIASYTKVSESECDLKVTFKSGWGGFRVDSSHPIISITNSD